MTKKRLAFFVKTSIIQNIKIVSVMVRATPIMETLTGFMIAGFISYSGVLIASGELEINNFFSTISYN